MSNQPHVQVSDVIREADNLRFQLARLLKDAEVLGDCMDAPVRLRPLIAVELTSLRTFIERYDHVREAVE